MSKILENLIKEITTETTVSAETVKELFEEEFANTESEESAAHNVKKRIKFMLF